MCVACNISRRILTKEKILSRFDKKYSIRYQALISEITNKIDLILEDQCKIFEQVSNHSNLEQNISIIFTISFEEELSRFFSWANHYPWYRLHFFLGYYDIDTFLHEKNVSTEWNNNDVTCTITNF